MTPFRAETWPKSSPTVRVGNVDNNVTLLATSDQHLLQDDREDEETQIRTRISEESTESKPRSEKDLTYIKTTTVSRPTPARSYVRLLRLESFAYLLGTEPSEEGKKIVYETHGTTFLSASILHIIPLLSSLAILIINGYGIFVGKELPGAKGEDSVKFLALQLVAKLLELLVLASLSSIVFKRLRFHLLSREGLPFGAIAACFQISKVSNLWSPEFVVLCRTAFARLRHRIFLVGIVLTATILGLIVGPATATALRPFIDDWPGGTTRFWLNATSSELFPQILDDTSFPRNLCEPAGATSCSTQYWDPISSGVLSFWPRNSQNHNFQRQMIEAAYIPGETSLRRMNFRFVGPFSFVPEGSLATIQPAPPSDAVGQLCALWLQANNHAIHEKQSRSFPYYNDVICTLKTLQPAMYVRCNVGSGASGPGVFQFESITNTSTIATYVDESVGSEDWIQSITGNRSHPGVDWVNLRTLNANQYGIGAIVVLPASTLQATSDLLLTCTIDAGWANTTIDVSFLNGPYVLSDQIQTDLLNGWFKDELVTDRYQPAELRPDWARTVNAFVEDSSKTVFEILCAAVGLRANSDPPREPQHAVEAILALMLTQGMGLTGHGSILQGEPKGYNQGGEWQQEILKPHGEVFIVDDSIKQKYPELHLTVKVNGYGYGYSVATLLSMITLAVYCLIVICHIFHSAFRERATSKCWENLSEVVTLALRSEPPDALVNTGAGISRLKTLQESARIVVRDDALQLQIGIRDALEQQVKSGVAYG